MPQNVYRCGRRADLAAPTTTTSSTSPSASPTPAAPTPQPAAALPPTAILYTGYEVELSGLFDSTSPTESFASEEDAITWLWGNPASAGYRIIRQESDQKYFQCGANEGETQPYVELYTVLRLATWGDESSQPSEFVEDSNISTQFHSVDKAAEWIMSKGMEDARNPERPYAVRFRGEIMPKRWTSMIPADVEIEWMTGNKPLEEQGVLGTIQSALGFTNNTAWAIPASHEWPVRTIKERLNMTLRSLGLGKPIPVLRLGIDVTQKAAVRDDQKLTKVKQVLDYIKLASGNPDFSPTIDWGDFTEYEFENEEDAVAYASRKLFAAAGAALSAKQADNQEKIENAEREINTAELILTTIKATNTRLQTEIDTVTESITTTVREQQGIDSS